MLHCDTVCHPGGCHTVLHSCCPFTENAHVICRPSAHCNPKKEFISPPVKPSLAPPHAQAVLLPPIHMPGLPVGVKAKAQAQEKRSLDLLPALPAPLQTFKVPHEIPYPSGSYPSILPRTLIPGPEYTSGLSFSTPSYPLGPPHSNGSLLTIVRTGRGALSVVKGNGAFVFPSSMVWDGPLAPHIVASRPAPSPGNSYGGSAIDASRSISRSSYDPSSLPPAGKAVNRGMLPSYFYHSDIPTPATVPRARGSSYGLFRT